MTTAPAPEEREVLLRDFAKALFKSDMDALYRVVTPDFLWLYHDGVLVTKLLSGAEAIKAHLAEQKILFSEQRFQEVSYHHLLETTFMTFRVSETVAGPVNCASSAASSITPSGTAGSQPRTFIESRHRNRSERLSRHPRKTGKSHSEAACCRDRPRIFRPRLLS